MPQPALQLLQPALFRHEDVALLVPEELRGADVRASVDGGPLRATGLADGTPLALGNTGDAPDGVYSVLVEAAGVGFELPFEVAHQHFLDSRRRFGPPESIAHRGGRSDVPENTLAALCIALQRADRCEFDVRLTRDEQLVVVHDPSVDRTTDGVGAVADMTLAEFRELRSGGQPLPTFAEALQGLGGGHLQIHVKLEEDDRRNTALLHSVGETLAQHGYEERCTILATRPRTLDILNTNSALRLDIDVHEGPMAAAIRRLGLEWLLEGGHRLKTSDFHLEGSAMVHEAHAAGLPLVCWARDSSDRSVERLLRLGVDSVMTDYPERMGPIIERLTALAERS